MVSQHRYTKWTQKFEEVPKMHSPGPGSSLETTVAVPAAVGKMLFALRLVEVWVLLLLWSSCMQGSVMVDGSGYPWVLIERCTREFSFHMLCFVHHDILWYGRTLSSWTLDGCIVRGGTACLHAPRTRWPRNCIFEHG